MNKKSNWSLSLFEICLINFITFLLADFALVCGYLLITVEIISLRLVSNLFRNASSIVAPISVLKYSHISLIFNKIFLHA